MLKVDASKAVDSLDLFEKELTKRLEQMVEGFAYEVGSSAVDKTPIGDVVLNKEAYLRRQKLTGLEPIEGFAQGSWRYAESTVPIQQEYYDGDWAKGDIETESRNYKLGNKFYIINSGPYIKLLEVFKSSDQAPDGILQPTMKQIQSVYKTDLQRYYKMEI